MTSLEAYALVKKYRAKGYGKQRSFYMAAAEAKIHPSDFGRLVHPKKIKEYDPALNNKLRIQFLSRTPKQESKPCIWQGWCDSCSDVDCQFRTR